MTTKERLQALLPEGSTIFTVIKQKDVSGDRLVDAYTFTCKDGAVTSHWLNKQMRQLGLATLSNDERIELGGTGYNAAQEVAERLGTFLYNNRVAFSYGLL